MGRCAEHDILNCKCKEPLALFLVRQFAESSRERVARVGSWVSGDPPGDPARSGDRANFGIGRGDKK